MTPDGTGRLSKEKIIAIVLIPMAFFVIILIVVLRRRTSSSEQGGGGEYRVYWLNMSLSIGEYRWFNVYFSAVYTVT